MKSKFINLSLFIVLTILFQACDHFPSRRILCNSFSGRWNLDSVRFNHYSGGPICSQSTVDIPRNYITVPMKVEIEEPYSFFFKKSDNTTMNGIIDLFPDSMILEINEKKYMILQIESFEGKSAKLSLPFLQFCTILDDSIHFERGQDAIIYLSRQ